MKINELNKPDQLEEGPVWDKVKQLGAGTKGFFQGGATGARAGYNAQGTANQMTGKIKDISMLVLNKWQEFNQAYKMANGGQDAGAEQAVQWFIKFTGGQKPKNPNPPSGDSPAQIQKWLQQEIANTMAQRAMAKVQGDLPDISGLTREELLQLRQQLTATGLNEDILNEVDWSKVKNAVAGGAISLAALGLPGLANADAQKMTPEQIRAWVQQSVKNKTPLQAQQIVNKLNVVPAADTPAAATPAPTATPAPVKAEPVAPTVDPSVARKSVSTLPPGGASKPDPVAKPVPAPVAKAEPKTEPAPVAKAEPKAEPKSNVDQGGKLSIKGVEFGMDEEKVRSIMGNNFTIFGVDGWEPEFEAGKLIQLSLGYKGKSTEFGLIGAIRDFQSAVESKFGPSKDPAGLKELGYYNWNIKDSQISIKAPTLSKYTGKLEANLIWATITAKSHVDKVNNKGEEERKSKVKDFE